LLTSSEEFKKQVTALLEEFHARGPFGSHITCEKAFENIANIKQQLAQLKEDEAALRRGLAIFKIDLPPSKDIAKVEAVRHTINSWWRRQDLLQGGTKLTEPNLRATQKIL